MNRKINDGVKSLWFNVVPILPTNWLSLFTFLWFFSLITFKAMNEINGLVIAIFHPLRLPYVSR
jgi:uncharacterized protein (DUF983 family)